MKKILFFLKVPPPFTGATYINFLVNESKLLNDSFIIHKINVSYKKSIESRKIFSISKFYKIISYHFLLLKGILRFKPHIVYFQISPFGLAFYRDCGYVFLIKLFNIPIIYHIHGKGIQKYIGNSKIKGAIYRWVFKKSYIICLAESLLYDVKDICHTKPYIVNNAIPLNTPETDSHVVEDKITILFFSNLIYSKGIYDFLDSILYFTQNYNHSKINAVIAGKEADISKKDLEKEITDRNISDKVIYVGAKYGNEKSQVFFDSHIFVFPTFHYNEAFPVVLIEAMQAGLPIIATREGAIPEIVDDGVTGFLVDKNNPIQIAERLEVLISDRKLCETMGAEGRKKYLEKYTLNTFETNLKNVFEDILKKCNAR